MARHSIYFSPPTLPIRKNWKRKAWPRRGARISMPSGKLYCGRGTIPAWTFARRPRCIARPSGYIKLRLLIRSMHRTAALRKKHCAKAGGVRQRERSFGVGRKYFASGGICRIRKCDAGILAFSLVLSPAMKGRGRTSTIPENLYMPIEQGAVVLLSSKNQQPPNNFLPTLSRPAQPRCWNVTDLCSHE